jgi:hypothetical protein
MGKPILVAFSLLGIAAAIIAEIALAWALTGCDQAPEFAGIESPTPAPIVTHIEVKPALSGELTTTTPLAGEAVQESTQSSKANAIDRSKWNAYAQAYRDVVKVLPPTFSGIPDPAQNSAYVNALAQKMDVLKAAKAAIENDLAPSEKDEWSQYQRELRHENIDD